MTRCIAFEHLWTVDGWMSPAHVTIDAHGRIASLDASAPANRPLDERIEGYAVPGMANLHSHAFQRLLAGRCEIGTQGDADNLWTWRERMYAVAQRIEPQHYEDVAAFTYMEMLLHGFTRVAEFHYLHHAPGGARYGEPAEMSWRLAAGARRAGIGLTVLPTLYAHAGIGRAPLPEQARFVHTEVDEYLDLVASLHARRAEHGAAVGIALHSLRAVAPGELSAAVAGRRSIDPGLPLHIHVSETTREVEECVAGLGARPVQWLLDHAGLDAGWTLVHATHLDESERSGLARSGAIAGLCPMTEAMLGDGLFPLLEYQREGGRWGIGTDSHYASGVAAELRMLECGQRLGRGRRNVLADPHDADPRRAHSGERLYALALAGARALGQASPPLSVGARADIVVLDPGAPTLAGHDTPTVLDAWLLSGAADPVRDVMAGGRWMVRAGTHVHQASIVRDYVAAVHGLLA